MSQLFGVCRIGNDPELRYTPNGNAVINLALAFSYGRKGQDGKRPTTWTDASLWGKQAEAMAQYLTKGTQLCVTIRDVHIEEFQRRDGTSGSKLVGDIASIEFAGGGQQQGQQQQQRQPAPPPRQQQSQQAAPRDDEWDQDIPFAPYHDINAY